MYTFMHIYTYTCMYIYTCMCTYIYIYIYTHGGTRRNPLGKLGLGRGGTTCLTLYICINIIYNTHIM